MFRLPSPSPQIGVQSATVLSYSVGPVVGVAPGGADREPLPWAGVGWGGPIQPRRGKLPLVRLLEKLINLCCPSCCRESSCPGARGGGGSGVIFMTVTVGVGWLASWPQTPPSLGQGGRVEQARGEHLAVWQSPPPPGQPCPVGPPGPCGAVSESHGETQSWDPPWDRKT